VKLLSVNLAAPRFVAMGERWLETGIYKKPSIAPVRVTQDGLEDDTVCDTRHHGGPDQAVYIYGGGDYAWWARVLGEMPEPGAFGENLTVSDLESASFCAGDQLFVGSVVLQVTAPRIPCGKFAYRMKDPGWVKRFRDAERPGLYCRVLVPGMVQAGDAVSVQRCGEKGVTMLELFRLHYAKAPDQALMRHALAAPVSARLRKSLEARLKLG
jgi:MOSC domain-containing protein YiiM